MTQTAAELASPGVISVAASSTAREAAKQMADHDIGDVLVSDDAGGLAGILTDRDLVTRVLAADLDPDHCTAGDVASTHLVTVDGDEPLDRVVGMARQESVRRIVILRNGGPIGIVSWVTWRSRGIPAPCSVTSVLIHPTPSDERSHSMNEGNDDVTDLPHGQVGHPAA